MSDFLSQDDVDQFREAMRSVTDTFHKTPITLQQANGRDVDLLAGVKPDDGKTQGEANGELAVTQDRSEVVERWVVSLNRDYLAEKGLIDLEEPEAKQLKIAIGDRVWLKGRRFAILELSDKALFRGVPVLVRLVIGR